MKFAKTGRTVTVTPGQSIFDAVLAEGYQIPHGCKRGECGLCATSVVGGPDHRDFFLDERRSGATRFAFTCLGHDPHRCF
ncbi:2Fe-2S iron-sulfur cluster-binding protein [Bradyrhizobium liaoningense]